MNLHAVGFIVIISIYAIIMFWEDLYNILFKKFRKKKKKKEKEEIQRYCGRCKKKLKIFPTPHGKIFFCKNCKLFFPLNPQGYLKELMKWQK